MADVRTVSVDDIRSALLLAQVALSSMGDAWATEQATDAIARILAASQGRLHGWLSIEPAPALTATAIRHACLELADDLIAETRSRGWLNEVHNGITPSAPGAVSADAAAAATERAAAGSPEGIAPGPAAARGRWACLPCTRDRYGDCTTQVVTHYDAVCPVYSHGAPAPVAGSETSGPCPTAGDTFQQGNDPGDENDCREARRLMGCE